MLALDSPLFFWGNSACLRSFCFYRLAYLHDPIDFCANIKDYHKFLNLSRLIDFLLNLSKELAFLLSKSSILNVLNYYHNFGFLPLPLDKF